MTKTSVSISDMLSSMGTLLQVAIPEKDCARAGLQDQDTMSFARQFVGQASARDACADHDGTVVS